MMREEVEREKENSLSGTETTAMARRGRPRKNVMRSAVEEENRTEDGAEEAMAGGVEAEEEEMPSTSTAIDVKPKSSVKRRKMEEGQEKKEDTAVLFTRAAACGILPFRRSETKAQIIKSLKEMSVKKTCKVQENTAALKEQRALVATLRQFFFQPMC